MLRLAVTVALAGCVTTASIAKPNNVSLPLLVGAIAADLVVTAVGAKTIRDFSAEGAIATSVAVTAADVVVGCILGGCSSLKTQQR
jgi:hypothetical protein